MGQLSRGNECVVSENVRAVFAVTGLAWRGNVIGSMVLSESVSRRDWRSLQDLRWRGFECASRMDRDFILQTVGIRVFAI